MPKNNINEIMNQDTAIRFRLESQEEEFIFKPDER